MEFVQENLLPHWPFIVFVLVISVWGQVLKQLFTRELAKKNSIIFWLRRIFPLILMLFGVLTGFLWPGETSPGIDSTVEKIWYFMGAAGTAIIGFNVFKTWIKKKYDIDIMPTSKPPKPR
jgi:hypothetical protein